MLAPWIWLLCIPVACSQTVARIVIAALVAVLAVSETQASDEPSLTWVQGSRGLAVVLQLLSDSGNSEATSFLSPEQWQAALSMRVGGCTESTAQVPAMLASIEVEPNAVWLIPAFPLDPSAAYCARLDPKGEPEVLRGWSDAALEAAWEGEPATQNELAIVERIVPSGVPIPANALRLYIEFSRPMFARDVHTWVRLRDDTVGKWVDTPFVEIPEGLWDDSRHRLTLIFHPGRIKRGVGPNVAMGPPLIGGHDYTLLLSPPDTLPAEHRLQVTAEDRQSIDPQTWEVTRVAENEVRIDFGEPLDIYLAERMIRATHRRTVLEGSSQVSPRGDYVVMQLPDLQAKSPVEIQTHRSLEDLAGNRVGILFDRNATDTMAVEGEPSSAWITVHSIDRKLTK